MSFAAARSASAQCTSQWQAFDPSTSIPGVVGDASQVSALTMWDPDGAGPQTPKLVVGGNFTVAGNTFANNIAAFDPATGLWSPLGSGMTQPNITQAANVLAVAVLPNGDLVAGGTFGFAGGVIANGIARWNGSTWSALGSGLFSTGSSNGNPTVEALVVMPNGDLIAGGFFDRAAGVFTNRVARWNGSTWSALGSGLMEGVNSLAVLANGDLVAGGYFRSTVDGVITERIARWNGSAWSALGLGTSEIISNVTALAVLANGDLVAGGLISTEGAVLGNAIARWNGSAWSPLGSRMNGSEVNALAVLPNGDLIVAGRFFTAGNVVTPNIARWGCVKPICDSIDFNQNSLFPEDQDLIDFLNILAGGECSAGNTCNDIDFNNDGLFPSDDDIVAFLRVLAGGAC